ncbi:MAG: hypothetical protein GY813_00355, partial [Halieaceae bacterium]|nr:hypothetical protein [Halieaceae bacterium]
AGLSHICGVTTSGEPLCWGSKSQNQATVPTTLTVTRVDLSPAGFYRPGKDDIPCPAGWTSRPGAITVLGCSIRYSCSLGQEGTRPNCTLCSPGTHRSLLSSPNCTSCAKGRYQDVAGGVNCTSCLPGTFADATGSTSASQCKSCSPGTFAAVDGSEKCALCPEGSFENVNGRYVSYTFVFSFFAASPKCLRLLFAYSLHLFCLSFHLLNQIKLTLILTTHTHTYSTHMLSPTTPTQHNNSTQCKTCPTRTFADEKGLTRCKVCQAGTKYDGALLVTATANPCASCPAGTYRDNNRTETSADNECATCEVGKSSPASAASASSCTSCAAGKVGRLENGACLCVRGMLCTRAMLYSHLFTHSLYCCASLPTVSTVLALCRDCSPGYYSSIVGSTSGCTYCPIGKYT